MSIAGQSVADPCADSFFSQVLKGNALLCSQKQQLTEAGQSEIQSVAANASLYYGGDSTTAQVAAQAATAQEMNVSSDVNSIVTAVGDSSLFHPFSNADCDGFDFSIVGGGCVKSWYVYGAVALIILFVLGPYILPFVSAYKGNK